MSKQHQYFEPGNSKVVKGIVLMIGAVTIFSIKDAAAKYLSNSYSLIQIIFTQYGVMFLLVLPILISKVGLLGTRSKHMPSLLMRGIIGVSAVFCLFLAVSKIPLADATAIIFISPIVVTLFSPLLLGENVGIRRWAAVVIGFMGVLLIVQPGFERFNIGTVSAFVSGVLFGFYGIITRKLTSKEPVYILMFYTSLVGIIGTGIFLPFYWKFPDLPHFLMLLSVGAITTVGHALMVLSYASAPAVIVTPFLYTSIIAATIIGYFAFGNFPGLIAWTGIFVIILCGIYIGYRESKPDTF